LLERVNELATGGFRCAPAGRHAGVGEVAVALLLFARERERQARHDERHEKDRQSPLSPASEGDDSVLGRVEGLSPARVSTIADLQGVTSGFDWHLDRVMQCDRPDTLTVDQDIVRATTDLHADCFSRHL
jgi:hypothetical protein